ncbi:hypothetical protein PtA15_18A390 [Puccinia triticina]|uniref:non-specific serine/threonine protein kinase n=1 Tax=Puccinia triticina TaxID=208348 RepID=A0ABY7D8T8_9BASI|nr:uncharacterized protein PtA15_18A390 [Puccinia triticina]WAQ93330.1 hypothetical protein PtA15_18A390 [Puccinia triticina]
MKPSTNHPIHPIDDAMARLELPTTLPGGWTIGQEIGRGSFAVVYRAHNQNTHQEAAVKAVVKSKLTTKLFQNLHDEIAILKKIRHPNVVGLEDCRADTHHIFLIMQFSSLGDLSLYIKNPAKTSSPFPHPPDGGLNEWIIRSFLGQLADALRFLRSHSIIHRDIKPQNLLLHPSEDPPDPPSTAMRYVPQGIPILRVADFGFARVLAPNAGLAETLCGSPLYMAPEILRYEKYDAKADLWSVGAVLFETATGKPPFRAQNHVELLRKIEKSEDRIAFPPDKPVPADLRRLILGLLRRNPAERASFEHFFVLADQVSSQGPLLPPTTTTTTTSSSSSPSPQPLQPSTTASLPLQPQLTPLHSTALHHQQPRPPSTSTLPSPATTTKGKQPTTAPVFDGEPGAFIVPIPQPHPESLPSSSHHPGFLAPSPSLLPTPHHHHHQQQQQQQQPQQSTSRDKTSWQPSFPAKYLVPSSSNPAPSVKAKDYARAPLPFRTSSEQQQQEDDEDRELGTEYVVVEKGAVEINALVDGLSAPTQKPLSLGRRMSRGFMAATKPTLAGLSSSPRRVQTESASPPTPSSFPPRPHPQSSVPSGSRPMNIAPHHGQQLQHQPSSLSSAFNYASSPRSFDSSGAGAPGSLPAPGGKFFPPSAPASSSPGRPPSARVPFMFPSSALSRALLDPCCPLSPSTGGAGALDAVESRLLAELEEAAAKALVILRFADAKLAAVLPPPPSASETAPVAGPSSSGPSAGLVGAFITAHVSASDPLPAVSASSSASSILSELHLLHHPAASPADPECSARRLKQAKAGHAAEALVLFIRALAVLDHAIRHAVAVADWKKGAGPGGGVVSPETGCAIEWLRRKFNEVFDKTELVKSSVDAKRLLYPANREGRRALVSATQLMYERALEASRAAAVLELLADSPATLDACWLEYQCSMWLLHAALDPVDDVHFPHDELAHAGFVASNAPTVLASIAARLAAIAPKRAAP